ncbi:Rpr2-domain-containing protein [Corynespora cassiicola Philippines]|uniref:Rpr2-domain-containing protein n=1 Tax=Corynespora cassiicola Philippines TaxID=1448308 RepID=A0A2T2NED9_CORCC|nr:Rpr2-domain-containing protein [Corynespora cassiicola Philippines]
MAKDKPPKAKGIPNKHLHARTTFLYQAATYLTLQAEPRASETTTSKDTADFPLHIHAQVKTPLAIQLGSHLQTVSRKGQVRLSADIKRTVCKSCSTLLVPGRTSTQEIENKSKGGKKPWADVLVIVCLTCGAKKRFPVGAKRQEGKAKRKLLDTQTEQNSEDPDQFATSVMCSGTDLSSASALPTPQG